MFSTQSDNCTPIVHIFDIIFLFAAELEEPKIGISGKGLKQISDKLYALFSTVIRRERFDELPQV